MLPSLKLAAKVLTLQRRLDDLPPEKELCSFKADTIYSICDDSYTRHGFS